MRKILSTLLFILLCITSLNGAIIMLEDFEDLTVNYTVSDGEFYDSGNDYFTIVPLNGAATPDDGPYTGFNGANFFAAEDINDPQGPGVSTQTMTFTIDISGATGLKFSGLFAAGGNSTGGDLGYRYDAEDGVRVRAQIDGGTIQNLLAFEAAEPAGDTTNNELRIDANFDGIGDSTGFQPTSAMTAFNDIAITGTGNSLVLSIEVTSTAGDEGIAFDDIEVTGNVIPEPSSTALLGLAGIFLLGRRSRSKN